jgi:hypothetical protein
LNHQEKVASVGDLIFKEAEKNYFL